MEAEGHTANPNFGRLFRFRETALPVLPRMPVHCSAERSVPFRVGVRASDQRTGVLQLKSFELHGGVQVLPHVRSNMLPADNPYYGGSDLWQVPTLTGRLLLDRSPLSSRGSAG